MGEQLVIPELYDYQPLSDGALIDRMLNLMSIADEVTVSLSNEDGLIAESRHELQRSLVEVDREIAGLSVTAVERGLIDKPILKEV